MAGSGRIWPGQAGYGRSCRGLAEYGRVWPDMAGSDRLWPGLAGYGRVWPGLGCVVPLHLEVPEVVIINVLGDGRVVSRKYSDEPSSRHGRYESSRRTPDDRLQIVMKEICWFEDFYLRYSLVSLQLDSFLYWRLFQYSQGSNLMENDAELML
ncbi:hypothetical protein Tco_0010126 [Tanacetum coccineum]